MSNVTFYCTECKQQGQVSTEDYETTTESSLESMGKRIEHWTEIETTCSNTACSKEITITINQTEYPEGDLQPEEVNSATGAESVTIS